MTNYLAEGRRVLMRVDGHCQELALASTSGCAKVIAEALAMRASVHEQRALIKSVTSIKESKTCNPT